MVRRIGGPDAFPDEMPDAWEEAVIETCVPVIDRLPEYLRIDAASAVYTEARAHSDPNIPWAVVFDDETPGWIGAQLLSTCIAPDKQTPSQNLELRETIDSVDAILRDKDIERGAATVALAGILIQITAGKADTPFRVYADTARRMPMKYSWSDILVEQFGEMGCRAIFTATPDLKDIIRGTEAITDLYYDPTDLEHQVHPNSTSSLMHGFLPNDKRGALYTAAARQIRSLSQ